MAQDTTDKPQRPLTAKQRAFVEAYTTPGNPGYNNGAQAAREAGYKPDNADVIADQNLGKLGIKTAIAQKQAKNREKSEKKAFNWREKQELVLEMALAQGNLPAANAALKALGEHEGQFNADKRQSTAYEVHLHRPTEQDEPAPDLLPFKARTG